MNCFFFIVISTIFGRREIQLQFTNFKFSSLKAPTVLQIEMMSDFSMWGCFLARFIVYFDKKALK